jgi:N-acetyl-alpha-D-muramate 1-phosphate uridylyltransferase
LENYIVTMVPKNTNAIIFAAGLGSRFKPWTDSHPKALAIVNGKSLLQRNIEYLQQYGIFNVVVNVHHFPEQIIDALLKNNGWGSNVQISDERDAVLETGGGLLKAIALLNNGQAFVSVNADFLTNLNLNNLFAYHKQSQALITFGVTTRKSSRVLLLDNNNKLCGWRNTQTGEEKGPVLNYTIIQKQNLKERAYSCVVVYEPTVFTTITERGKFSIMDSYLNLAGNHAIVGYEHTGDLLVDVGRPESVAIAEALFK